MDLPSRRGFLQSVMASSVGACVFSEVFGSRSSVALPGPAAMASAERVNSIRVERVETFKVVVPYKQATVFSEDATELNPAWHNIAKGSPDMPKHIIKLYADNGQMGIGETSRFAGEAAVARNANFLVSRNILELDFCDFSLGLPESMGSDGFEIAIYDLLGKTFNVPVHFLLGGRFQDRVAVTYWTGQRSEAELVAVARHASEVGFKHLKFKARRSTPVDQLVRSLEKEAPELELGVDFNQAFSNPGAFLPIGKCLEGYRLTIEDPLPARLEWWREIRQRLDINLALTPSRIIPRGEVEETYYSAKLVHGEPSGVGIEILEAATTGACNTLNLAGNMRSFVRNAYLAEVAGMPLWHGSAGELGIRDMAMVHAAAATRSCTVASDIICFLRESDLLATPFIRRVSNGYAEVPRAPGLGVELDEDALRHYRVG